jgi:membrane associated rhomboid family serine protease
MADDQTYQVRRGEPMFNAPPLVVGVAVGLVALHGLTYLLTQDGRDRLLYDYALVPQRFFAPAGSPDAYPNILSKLLTLFSTGLLHGGWMHVLVNASMLLAFGAQTLRLLEPGLRGVLWWFALLIVSTVVGSAAFLAFDALLPTGATAAVGISGGVSGLMAATFIVGFDPRRGLVISPRFAGMTAVFLIANLVLALSGSAIVGAGIAWQAHVGGYAGGSAMMALLLMSRRPPVADETTDETG